MARGSDYALKIVINADDRASGTLHGIRGALAGLGDNLRTVGQVGLAGLGALAGAAVGAGAGLAKLAIDAAPLENIRASFAGLAEAAGVGADEMLAALDRAGAGMISQRDLMISFNKASQLVSTDFAKKLPDAMQYLGRVAASTGTDLNYLLDSLVVGVGRLSPMILDNLGISVSLSEAYENYARAVGKSASELTKQEQQTALMNAVLEKLRQNTASLPDVTGTAAQAWQAFRTQLTNLKDEVGVELLPVMGTLLGTLQQVSSTVLPPLIDAFQTYIVPLLEKAATWFSTLIGNILAGQPPLEALADALGAIGLEGFVDTIATVSAKVGEFWTQVQPVAQAVAEWVGKNVQDVLTALGVAIATVVIPAIASVVTAIAPVVGAFLLAVAVAAALREAWENNFLGIRDFVTAAMEWIKNAITTVLTAIQDFWSKWGDDIIAIVNRFIGFFKEIFAAFQAAFEGDWRVFGEHLRAAFDQAVENIKELWQSLKSWFASIDWGEVGRNIISGIANGIRNAAGWLENAAKDAAKAALDAAKGFLGIHSPSAVFAEVGKNVSAGLAAGIRENIELPRRAGERLAGATVQGATGATGGSWQSVIIHHLVVNSVDAGDLLRQLQALSA